MPCLACQARQIKFSVGKKHFSRGEGEQGGTHTTRLHRSRACCLRPQGNCSRWRYRRDGRGWNGALLPHVPGVPSHRERGKIGLGARKQTGQWTIACSCGGPSCALSESAQGTPGHSGAPAMGLGGQVTPPACLTGGTPGGSSAGAGCSGRAAACSRHKSSSAGHPCRVAQGTSCPRTPFLRAGRCPSRGGA